MNLMQSHYQVNIALRRFHWARIILDEPSDEAALQKAAVIRQAFESMDGNFEVSMTHWSGSGRRVGG